MKRLLIILTVVLLLFAGLTGCAASTTTQGGTGSTTYATTTAGDMNEGGGDTASSAAFQRKVLKNVDMSLQSKDVEAAYQQILAYASSHGGYEFSRSQQKSDSEVVISAQIKIKPEFLDDFTSFIATVADVTRQQTSSSDITADYYDARTRLQTMEMTLETYYGYLEDAKNIDESLKVQRMIDDLTLQIEVLKGKLSMWDSLLAESTVSIYLVQEKAPVETRREIKWSALTFDDMGYLIKAGFTAVVNTLVVILQWLAISLAVMSPLLLIALVILLLIRRHLKIKARKMAAHASEVAQRAQNANASEKRES